MSGVLALRSSTLRWMQDARFDSIFILGLPILALLCGLATTLNPTTFYPILLLDLWLLGYHHVISTYTRLCFDKESLQENRFLVFGLTPIVAAATLLIAWQVGLWAIITIYFYWQWWHYTRQSWGVKRVYRRKDPNAHYENDYIEKIVFYALPVFGVLHRSAENHARFLGFELRSFPVPPLLAELSGYIALALFLFWVVRQIESARKGRLAIVHTMYMLSHFTIFAVAYTLLPNLTFGWLVINVWHNSQYILFVWLYNSKRFKNGIEPKARFLSYISQSNRFYIYFLVCLAITSIVYWSISQALANWIYFSVSGVAGSIIVFQAINFHHYIVDSVIWKVRKPKMRETLELEKC